MPPFATPMMQQYHEAKRAARRCAAAVSHGRLLRAVLRRRARRPPACWASRSPAATRATTRCRWPGFPHHQLDAYLAKIIAAGHRAAICEQVEDPKLAKGLVKREVTRIVTPGTLTDDALLDPQASNFLAAVAHPSAAAKSPTPPVGLAWVDVSTGRFFAAAFPAEQLADQLARIQPAELLGQRRCCRRCRADWTDERADHAPPGLDVRPHGRDRIAGQAFRHALARRLRLRRRADAHRCCRAAGRRRDSRLPGRNAKGIARAHRSAACRTRADERLAIDPATRRSLELVATIRDGRREGSLLGHDRPHGDVARRAAAGRLAGRAADRRGRDQRPARRGRRAGRRRGAHRPTSRVARADLRHPAAAGPRDHRPGQPARSVVRRPHARLLAESEGEADRPRERAVAAARSSGSICAPTSAARSSRRSSTTARSRPATAASSAPATAPTSTSCAS